MVLYVLPEVPACQTNGMQEQGMSASLIDHRTPELCMGQGTRIAIVHVH